MLMKRVRSFLTIFLLFLTFSIGVLAPTVAQESTQAPESTPRPRPFPITVLTEAGVNAEIYFEEIKQGGIGLVRVIGSDISGVQALFFNRQIAFFPIDGEGWLGLIAVNMDLSPRAYTLALTVQQNSGEAVNFNTQVEVTLGGFIRQDFSVPADRAYLIDPEIERGEFARLDSIREFLTPEKFWTNLGFSYPINSEITSPFGAFRILNQTTQTRHTGWDLRAPVGTPVITMGPGKVAFAGRLDIRGDYVMVDHGFGIYSGYAHLSQVHVTRGQTLSAGQIIGVSGNTGRSNGPHLHWEVSVNGEWVDSVEFLQLWLP